MSYSQNNEETVITSRLSGILGRFLDIGAYDGRTFSNTLRLAELGWSGVCVEASPTVFPKLLATHSANPRITLVLAAISPAQSQLVKWYDSQGDAVSTTVLPHKIKWEQGSAVRFQEFYRYTVPLTALCVEFGYNFEFINIDVEATNFALFTSLPWKMLDHTKVICVEHDNHVSEMATYASVYGFKQISLNAENLILAR